MPAKRQGWRTEALMRQHYQPPKPKARWASPALAVCMGLALAELLAQWAMGTGVMA